MYDLMGQASGVPVYQLFGQKYRSWVPVGSWTVSTAPERMAEAVEKYVARGYTWLKYHLSPFENVIDQTEAMEKVAPEGFKIQYDFTMHGTDDHMPELLTQLAQYRIAGCFEDPLPGEDLAGYSELRQRIDKPIVLHHFPMRATHEIYMRLADAYMLGHFHIGEAAQRAGLFAAGNVPFMMQNTGGNITRAMAMHMMAAFPSATLHLINAKEIWKSDVVFEDLEPVNGFVRVPEAPGLGLPLDRDELERLKSLEKRKKTKFILKSRFKNGTRMYNVPDPENPHYMVRPDWSRRIPMSFAAPISTEYWDDDGSAEFKSMYERVEREDVVLERDE
jgi:L-alanine-DL-glutamate epimerase-like enolase superfamily enzyme